MRLLGLIADESDDMVWRILGSIPAYHRPYFFGATWRGLIRSAGHRKRQETRYDMELKPVHKASCHCGAVRFAVALPNGLVDLERCNCSICRRRGAIMASVPLDGHRITEGEEFLRLYQFHTKTAKHYFCSKCGIYTHHQERSKPEQYAFNVRCLEGIDPFELGEVPVFDGADHRADRQSNEA